eukprot:CAMPEP_0202376090 /NCGR_PEP_ID=MMETSP1127-20130417/6656_1 /ASSEMBLY_ACC=CAM_ASM_000462 /TAXON_ID=3047 /ORGANISM="Dunaliella tertiolecta, Strain CCMP1320" /LENGTH=47 /DNA_ID= /DNA_START= /DNA_END= /DNA_ORIENTATION=
MGHTISPGTTTLNALCVTATVADAVFCITTPATDTGLGHIITIATAA